MSDMEEIIFKECTRQELTEREKVKLDEWLREGSKNRKIYSQMKLAMSQPDSASRNQLQEQTWRQLMMRLKKHDQYRMSSARPAWRNAYKLVAVLTILLSALFIVYQYTFDNRSDHPEVVSVKMIEKVSLPGQKITTVLPDGTRVKLNADSKLTVPSYFAKDMREITLIGEAFFDVERDEERPFLIRTENMLVKVLGTSFNVRAYRDTEQSVAVKSGQVEVQNSSNEELIRLEPMEMTKVQVDGKLKNLSIENPELAFGWVDQQMVFDNHEIDQVLGTIGKWYGVEVIINKRITKDKKYTASFNNPTLEEVMDILAFVYDFKYKIEDGKKVIIQ